MVQLSEADNGTVVNAHVGDTVTVRLPENPTTGATWDVAAPAGVVRLVDSALLPGGMNPGAGGSRQLRFVAENPGRIDLTARLRRPWEPENVAFKTYHVTLIVAESQTPAS